MEAGRACDRRRTDGGFSMLELLLAMMLLMLVLSAVGSMNFAARTVQHRSHHVEAASSLAEYKIEQLQASALRSVVSGSDTVRDAQGLSFYRQWSVQDQGACKKITVSVTWENGSPSNAVTLTGVVR